jgi:TRAP-type C4-dicarboxylate transport system substrate-binding protein
MMKRNRLIAIVIAAGFVVSGWGVAYAQEPTVMRAVGNFSQNKKQVDGAERPFFEALAKNLGAKMKVEFNPMDVLGIQAADAFRLMRSGAFDVMSIQIGMASRDDPFFEGLDLIGVAPDMNELRKVVTAYREVFDRRLQQKFHAKVLTLWPFGPQTIYCNAPITSVDDLKGQKVRVFTPSMAALMQSFGATPVTIQFSEVYPSLQRGVATCAVTAPTAGNSAKWPEVTTHFLPLSLAGAVQGHFMNVDHWKRYSPAMQKKLEAEFKKLEDRLWDIAVNVNNDAVNCNVGREPCKEHAKFNMKLVQVTAADAQKVKAAVSSVVLPIWKKTCNNVDPTCSETWNQTVGKVTGLHID